MTAEQIAPIVHEAIRGLQRHLGQPVAPAWDECTWQKDSTIEGVQFALDRPSPGQQHIKWMEARVAAGWTYGPVKSDAKKTNPALVPFDQLPASEQAKDALVIAITGALKDA